MILQGISAAIFLLVAIRLVLIFFRAYHAAVRKVNNYYSNDVDQFVRWLYQELSGHHSLRIVGSDYLFYA